MMNFLKYFFPPLSFLGTFWLPAGTQVTFAFTSLIALVQARALANDNVRRFLGITLRPKRKPSESKGPYDGTMTKYTTEVKPKEPSLIQQAKIKAASMMGESGTKSRLTKQEKQRAEAYEKRRKAELDAEALAKQQKQKLR
jgi:hypothetical protein